MRYALLLWLAIVQCPLTALAQETPPAHGNGRVISIDLPDIEIRSALRQLADQYEINVVIPDSLQGRTSIKLRDVTWKQAYKVILEPIGYTFVEEGSVIRIEPETNPGMGVDVDAPDWLNGPWYIVFGAGLFFLATGVCHLALFIGVLKDTAVSPAFAPRPIWAVLVLLGGVVALAAYWLIHHSNLRASKTIPKE